MSQQVPNPWKVTIVGGAIAGLLTAVILALFDSAREWLFYKAEYTNLAVSLFIVVPLLAGLVAGGWLSKKSTHVDSSEQDSGVTQQTEEPQLPEADDIDKHVIRGLISFDGDWASVAEIGVRVGRAKLVVERSLGRLILLGYAKDLLAVGQESLYKLSPEGTTYAINNGFDRVSR